MLFTAVAVFSLLRSPSALAFTTAGATSRGGLSLPSPAAMVEVEEDTNAGLSSSSSPEPADPNASTASLQISQADMAEGVSVSPVRVNKSAETSNAKVIKPYVRDHPILWDR